jgi:Tol biopolymer transport system component
MSNKTLPQGLAVFLLAGISFAILGSRSYAVCSGSPLGQHQTDVTARLSMTSPGVRVNQITDTNGNWISYYDIPLYSSAVDRIFYNRMQMNQKVMADTDGANAQVLSSDPDFHPSRTRPLMLSGDGTLVYYAKTNPDARTVDLYAIHLTQPGACKETRLTNLNMNVEEAGVQISTSSVEGGKNVIAFANSSILHRVLEDGSALRDINLSDAESGDNFHRIRLNPKFSNILFYRRNEPGSHFNSNSLYVADLRNPRKIYNLASEYMRIGHMLWSPDGLQIGFNAEDGQWHIADVVRSDGSINADGQGKFPIRTVGPRQGRSLLPQFCSWSPAGNLLVCITRETGGGSKIFLMSSDGRAQVLASADVEESRNGMQGDTWAQFLGDERHVIFHSNRSGRPELYIISNINPEFDR